VQVVAAGAPHNHHALSVRGLHAAAEAAR
jgi:hypothetical protein